MKRLFVLLLTICSTFACFTACDIPIGSSNDSQSGSSSCEHTYEWVGSEGGHQKVYTCGCPSPDIVELHSDNNSDYVCDVCGWAMDGILPEIVPEASYFEVIDELQILDIQRIETVEYAGSVAPYIREPIEYKTSTLATDIETVYTWLKSLQGTLTQIADEEAQLAGAGTKIFTIYTSQNYYFTISYVGRNYLNIEGGFYEQEGNIPEIVGETVTYKFESYYDDAKVYIDGIQIGMADFAFEDIVCERVDAEQHERLLWMDTCIGTIDVYSSQYFGRNGSTYKIISGTDFTGIINKFFASFDETTRVNFEVEHDSHGMGYGNDNHLYPNTYVFYEIEHFKNYCDTEGLTRVRDRISSLDGKTLIVVEFYTGGSADSFDVANVGVSGDILTIHFTDPESGNAGATAAWVHYAVIIVDKNDFSGDASDVRFTFFDDWDLIPPVVSGEKIEFNAKYHNSYNWNENKSYPSVRIIRSFSEFTAYCTEHGIRNDFYDEAYFQDKYLVAIIEETRYAGGEVLIESVVCYGDKYFVSLVSVKDDYGVAAVMGERHCFIELDSSVSILAESDVIVYF